MSKFETAKPLTKYGAVVIRQALWRINYELKLKPIRATVTLAVVGFDLSALKIYSDRRYDLLKQMERIEEYAGEEGLGPVDLAVASSIWNSYDGYREKLLSLMTECEVVEARGKNSPNLLTYLERGEANESS